VVSNEAVSVVSMMALVEEVEQRRWGRATTCRGWGGGSRDVGEGVQGQGHGTADRIWLSP
jgi:hypothetical protein